MVLNWDFVDFHGNNELWYDANGLQMVYKQLWKRQDFTMYSQTTKIASNFYPVQSAIVMRDRNLNRQVTIMPDRTMAGSAGLRNGSNIELMMNRRIKVFDGYGVCEPLDDKDSDGYGLAIEAKYFMQIFDMKKGKSAQRSQQRKMELPIQTLYSKDFEIKAKEQNMQQSLAQSLQKMKVVDSAKHLKILPYMVKENEFNVRLTNMQDHFDADYDTEVVDLLMYAQKLTGVTDAKRFTIKETLLTGMPLKDMTQWVARDKPTPVSFGQHATKDLISSDYSMYKIALKPMEIRTFSIKVNQ